MKMKNVAFALCLVVGSIMTGFAQSIAFPAEKQISVRQITPMRVGNELKGYFCTLWKEDLKKEDKTLYNLLIMDVNFKIIRDVNFKVDDYLHAKREVFNGTSFCLTYVNEVKNVVYHLYLDDQGKKIGSTTLEDINIKDIYPFYVGDNHVVPYSGYFRTGPNPKREKYMDILDNAGKKMWRLLPKEVQIGKSKSDEEFAYFHGDSNFLVLDVTLPGIKKDDLGEKSDQFFRVYNMKTGTALFDISHRHDNGFLVPMKVQFEHGQLIVFGQYFELEKSGNSYNPKKNLGFYSQRYDQAGKLISENFSEWKAELSKYLEVDEQDQVEGDRNIWFHDIVRTADGNYFVICELYNRGFSNVFFSSGYVIIRDMIALELNDQLTLTNVHRHEKFRSQVQLTNIAYKSNYRLGEEVKRMNGFDYKYTTQSPDNAIFTSIYDNYDKSDKAAKKFVIGAIGYNQDGELVNPKISLTSDPDEIYILPAKTGYVAVVEYFKKLDGVTLTLYKFDL